MKLETVAVDATLYRTIEIEYNRKEEGVFLLSFSKDLILSVFINSLLVRKFLF